MDLIEEDDWDALSAYCDGELPAPDAAILEARLEKEPALQEALAQIQGIGLALRPLRPEIGPMPAAQKPIQQRYGYFAIAASIALFVTFAGQFLFDFKSALSPSDQHQAFLQQEFNVSTDDIRKVNSRSNIPDLTSANLVLVASVAGNDEIQAFHYAGRNGCRLTLAITKSDPPNINVTLDLLTASWSSVSKHYTLLATRMDSNRFATISKFIRFHFDQKGRPVTTMAMQNATETAAPCAAA